MVLTSSWHERHKIGIVHGELAWSLVALNVYTIFEIQITIKRD